MILAVLFLAIGVASCTGAQNITITFEENGGAEVEDLTISISSTSVNFPTPVRDGYTFDGWYLDEALTQPFTLASLLTQNTALTLYAKWTANVEEYTITFESNGGSAVTAITAAGGAAVTAPTDPTRSGYTFIGWYSDSALTTAYTFTTMPSENITVYAKWEIIVNNQTITFEENGGSVVADITQEIGSAVTAPTNPTKVGYTFAGWYSDSALTIAYTFSTMPADALTLYAKWTVNNYTITFEENGGSAVTDITQAFESAVVEPTAPTKEGNTFDGWYSDVALTTAYTFATMPAANTTLYAKWTVNNYTIMFEENGGSAVADLTQAFGSAVVAPVAPTKTGYTFDGWFSDVDLTTAYTFATMPAVNTTLYAKWTAANFTITFEENGGSAVTDINQAFGSAVVAPTDPTRSGYTFGGWFSDVALTTAYTFATMPSQNTTLYAKWTVNQYTITFEENGGTTVADLTQDFGSAVVEPLDPTQEGHVFVAWYSDVELTTVYTFATMPAQNITLYAKWDYIEYTLSFVGADIASLDIKAYDAIVLPADPTKDNYTFGGWFFDTLFLEPFDLTVMPEHDVELHALWEPNLYTLTYDTNGGTILDPEQVPFNALLPYRQDLEKGGYLFAGWYVDSTLETPLDGHRMPAGPFTLYAKWIDTDAVWTLADVLMYQPYHAKVQGTVIYKFPNPMDPGYYVYDGTAAIFVMAPSNDLLVGDVIEFDADFGFFEFTPQFTYQQNRMILSESTPHTPVYEPMTLLDILRSHPDDYMLMGKTIQVSGILQNQMGQYFLVMPGNDERVAINYKSINPMSDPFIGLTGQLVTINAIIHGFDPMGHMWHILYDPSAPVASDELTDAEKIDALLASADALNGMVFYPENILELPTMDPLFGATLTFETTGDNASYFDVTTGEFADTDVERLITLHISATLGLESGSVDVTLTLKPIEVLTIQEFFSLPDGAYGIVQGIVIFAHSDMGMFIIGDETGAILPVETEDVAMFGDLVLVHGHKYSMDMIAIMSGMKPDTILEVLAVDQPMPFEPVSISVEQYLSIDPMNSLYWGRIFTISGSLVIDDMYHEVFLSDGVRQVQLMIPSKEYYDALRDFEGLNIGMTGIALPNFDEGAPFMMFIVLGGPEDILLNYTDQEFVDMMALQLQSYLEDMTFIPGQYANLPTDHPYFDLTASYEVVLEDAALLDDLTWIISETITEETWISVMVTLTYGEASAIVDVELHVLPIDVLTIAEFKLIADEASYYVIGQIIFTDPTNQMMIVVDETGILFVPFNHSELMVGDLLLLNGQKMMMEDGMYAIVNSPENLIVEMISRGQPLGFTPTMMTIQEVLSLDPMNPDNNFIYIDLMGRLEKSPDEMNFYLTDGMGMVPIFVPDGLDPTVLLGSLGLDIRLRGVLMIGGDFDPMFVQVFLNNPGDIQPAFTDQELVDYLANMFETGGTEKPFRPGAILEMPDTYEPYGVEIIYETYGDNALLFDLTTGMISDTITTETFISVRLTFTYNEAVAVAEFDLHIVPIDTLTVAEFKLGTEGETYFVRGVVVMPQFEDGPMILADETGILFIVASLPLKAGTEVIIEGVLGSMEGIPLIWGNEGVISYEIVSESVPYPIEPEVLTIAQFNAIDMTDVTNWGRYVEVIGYIGGIEDSFYPLLQEYIDGGDFIPIVPMFLFQHVEPKIMMEPIFDPMEDFMNMQGFRFVVTGFLFPNMGEEDPYAPDRMLLIPTMENITLDYYTDQEKMDALILAGQHFLEGRNYRPFEYLEFPDYLPAIDANIIWEFVGTNGYVIDLTTMQINDISDVETLLFKATATIGALTQEYTFEITVMPYTLIMIEDFYGLQEGEFGKLQVIVAEVINGWEFILQEPMSLLYLHAYGFDGLNEGDEVIIFGQKEFYEGYVSMHGYSEYAYYTVLDTNQKEPLIVLDGDLIDLATRSTEPMNLLYYNAIKGHLVEDDWGTYYLTDGLHSIMLIPENNDVYDILYTYLNTDVAVKFLNYTFYYSSYGPVWSGYVLDAPNIIENITFTDQNIRGFMMDYLKNDLNYYFKDGLEYGFSTTHPIYGGTMTVTVNPLDDLIASVSGNHLIFAESEVENTIILTLTATYNSVDLVSELEIMIHPYDDDMDTFPVGSMGPLPYINYMLPPGIFGGLYVKEVDREYDWWTESTNMIVDLYFPYPDRVGASMYTLQYQDLITMEWHDYLWYDMPLTVSGDNLSIPVAGATTFRLMTDTGMISNPVHVDYETIDTYFAGWSLDQSMYISGVMSPFIGYGLELTGVTIKRQDNSEVSGGYTVQWFRVNPATFEMIVIEGATNHTYITTPADLGYMIMVQVRGDGVNAGGVLNIMAGDTVKIPVTGHISSASTTGFFIAFDYQMPIEELQHMFIHDHRWQPIAITNVILTATPYVYYVECDLRGVDFIQVELQGFQYIVGEAMYEYFNWGIYHDLRGF
jgi:uncharacterized repeat protein (TIGR02543 family)